MTRSGGLHTERYAGGCWNNYQDTQLLFLHPEHQMTTAAAASSSHQGDTENGWLFSRSQESDLRLNEPASVCVSQLRSHVGLHSLPQAQMDSRLSCHFNPEAVELERVTCLVRISFGV